MLQNEKVDSKHRCAYRAPFGGPTVSLRLEALRPRLTASLPLSQRHDIRHVQLSQRFIEKHKARLGISEPLQSSQIDWERLVPPRGYAALPRRWVVERTFSWLGQNGRLNKAYERLSNQFRKGRSAKLGLRLGEALTRLGRLLLWCLRKGTIRSSRGLEARP